MTKDFLHKKLQIGDKNFPLGKEIEQAEDLGASVSISPSYLFYYSADTGCQYIKTAQLTRIYAEIRIRRYSTSYLIFETKEKRRIKIRGQVDFLRARTVCDGGWLDHMDYCCSCINSLLQKALKFQKALKLDVSVIADAVLTCLLHPKKFHA